MRTVQGNIAYQRTSDSLKIVVVVFLLDPCLGKFKFTEPSFKGMSEG